MTEAERQRQMLITQNAEREFIMKRRWGGTLDVAGAIFSLFGILVFTFILFFLFIVFTNIRVRLVMSVIIIPSCTYHKIAAYKMMRVN